MYKRIHQLADKNESIVLVVPEQFSFESEKTVLALLGDVGSNYVSVLPFSRIYETVGRIKGGVCGKVLTNADKNILMNRAISAVYDSLQLWGKFVDSMQFSAQMLAAIDEFKFAGISSSDLFSVTEKMDDCKLKLKLHDTALIYESYVSVLGTAFVDPTDYMDKLYLMLESCDYFNNKTVFFDGFKSFSGQQFKVIDRIVSSAKNTVFTFIDDRNDTRKYSLLTNVRKTKNRVLNILKKHGIDVAEDIYLENSYYNNDDLKILEQSVFGGDFKGEFHGDAITVCQADTIYDETEYVARTIRKIVRTKGASYSDFVVIARDTETYEDALTVACKRNLVNIFIDKKITLSSMPISTLIISAVEFTKSASADNIFDFYKTGIAGISTEDIGKVEEYSYIWDIDAEGFLNEWDMNPLGLTDNIPLGIEDELNSLNKLRKKIIEPLFEFKKSFSGTPRERAAAIFNLLERVNAKKYLSELSTYYKNKGEFEYADVLRQSYSQFISLLDSVVDCFPDTVVSKPAFFEALKTVLSLNSVGVVPQTLDEVVFGSAERIRPARPKYVFILGANQGIYPRLKTSTGLFTDSDLSVLKSCGFDINDKAFDLSIDEQLLIYTNLCCASDRLYISYTNLFPDNTAALPSHFVTSIKQMGAGTVVEPDVLSDFNIPETLESSVVERFKRLGTKDADSQLIYDALKTDFSASGYNIEKYNITAENAVLSTDTTHRIFANEINLSATRLEKYSSCKFKYYCEYIAKAVNKDKAKFSPMQRGTIIHYVLDRIFENHKDNMSEITESDISNLVDKYCQEYLESVPGYFSFESEKIKYIIFTIKRTLRYLVRRILIEFSQSKFKPAGCEVKIGKNRPVSISTEIEDGFNLVLKGSVDRIDTYEDFVRIVDYKTGEKSFSLSEVLDGLNMQMLIYLHAIKNSKLYGEKPAGILYLTAERSDSIKKANGLIVDDPDVVFAMEQENKGQFIPKYGIIRSKESFITPNDYTAVLNFVDQKIKEIGRNMLNGDISAVPVVVDNITPCKYCDYRGVCRNEDAKRIHKKLSNEETVKIMGGENVG